MPIPTAELNIITGAQADLAAAKTALATVKSMSASLIARSNAMYDLKAGDWLALTMSLEAKAAFRKMNGLAEELLGVVEATHANLGRALVSAYGADGQAIVVQGGGGRR
jgi:hypothetical protein